jgi:hypothetical protein
MEDYVTEMYRLDKKRPLLGGGQRIVDVLFSFPAAGLPVAIR